MEFTFHFFRHVRAPKRWALINDREYDFRRPVDNHGIQQGIALSKQLKERRVKPILVFHSMSPRSIVSAHLACADFRVPFIELREFWPSDENLAQQTWEICCCHQFRIKRYLQNPHQLAVYKLYGERIWDEIRAKVWDYISQDWHETGDILIFGHAVWNCFAAWATAGCPEHKRPFFRRLRECDSLIVKKGPGKDVEVQFIPFIRKLTQ